MKNIFFYIITVIFFMSDYVFSQNNISGIYTHEFEGRVEILEIKPDSTFWYCCDCSLNNSWGAGNSFGHWKLKDSLLLLNSVSPQQITFNEDFNKIKSHILTINVFPSNFPVDANFQYNLYVLTKKNDTISFFKRIERQIRINEHVKSLWIEDSSTGIKSKPYNVLSKRTNIITILFYRGLVFKNEYWIFLDKNRIKPRSFNRELQKYIFERKIE